MSMPEDVVNGSEVRWIPCPGCAGEIGVPPHWLAHTVACPKCGAIVSISEVERVLWRPPKPAPKKASEDSPLKVAEPAQPRPAPMPERPTKPAPSNSDPARIQKKMAEPPWFNIGAACLLIGMLLFALVVSIVDEFGAELAAANKSGQAELHKGRTRVFGIAATGESFVYVFDRSASMGSGSASALGIAKRELLKSLADLNQTNQFQIIFYNERFSSVAGDQQAGGLLFANHQNQELAEKHVRGIMADGGTHHAEAIEAALRLAPDVIFFLSDCDLPAIPDDELARIKRLNSGRTVIHVIELGLGAPPSRENFLGKLARQNGGRYAYVDISRAKAPNPGAATP